MKSTIYHNFITSLPDNAVLVMQDGTEYSREEFLKVFRETTGLDAESIDMKGCQFTIYFK